MIYDTKHKALLDDNWVWDGEVYDKGFAHNPGDGESIRLSPHISGKDIEKTRRGNWDLLIHILNIDAGEYYWSRVCQYNNFYEAAKAVLGNK